MDPLSLSKTQSWLPWFLRGILLFGLVILLGRVIELQVIKGSYFRQLAEGNRIRRVPIEAPRGRIVARGGETLVGNSEVKRTVIFDPAEGYEKINIINERESEDVFTEWERDYQLLLLH